MKRHEDAPKACRAICRKNASESSMTFGECLSECRSSYHKFHLGDFSGAPVPQEIPIQNPYGWAYTILSNLRGSNARKLVAAQNRVEHAKQTIVKLTNRADHLAKQLIADAKAHQQFLSVFNKMPAHFAVAVTLRMRGKDYGDIAQMLGVSPESAMQWFHHGKTALLKMNTGPELKCWLEQTHRCQQ